MSNSIVSLLRQIDILRQALSSDKNKVAFFLGAGRPVSINTSTDSNQHIPLIPDIAGLTALACEKLAGNRIDEIKGRILEDPTIEDILSHVWLLIEVVGEGQIDNFSKGDLETLEKNICAEITQAVDKELPAVGPHITI